jgi:uncharacterized protein YhaN
MQNLIVPPETDSNNKVLEVLNEALKNEQQQLDLLITRKNQSDNAQTESNIEKLEKRLDTVSEELSQKAERICEDLSDEEKTLVDGVLEGSSDSLQRLVQIEQGLEYQLQQQRVQLAGMEAVSKSNYEHRNEGQIEEEINRISRQKQKLEQRGEALEMAMDAVLSAAKEIQNKHIPKMNERFNQVFSELTCNKYSDIRAGDGLQIMINEPETKTVVPAQVLSEGTIDQLYLALRIAAADTITKNGETFPLILDEPFSQYDDRRIENTMRYIYEISKKRQVIIFTCKQREKELIERKYQSKIYSLT